jgi:pimeloyl-ACP methyl ester carboxylesterase
MLNRILRWFACCFALALAAGAQTVPTKYVEVYGQKIYYQEAGAGPDVILLHGLGGDSSVWSFTIPALSARFHVYAPDQIGFGMSDKPLIHYHVRTLTDFLNGFCEKLGIAHAALVGNSLGGWEALDFTLTHPDKVTRLVLADSAGYSQQRTGAPPLDPHRLEGLNPSTLAETKTLMAAVFHNPAMSSDQFVAMAFARHLHHNDGYTIDGFIDSILRQEDVVDGKLGAIKIPTLIVWGRDDQLIPLADSQAFAEDIAGSQTEVFDNCGHVPPIDCVAPFNAALLKFLSAQ